MRYALIQNGVVANIIWLYPGNASEFPSAVALEERPVAIGDAYANGTFTRDGERVMTPDEETIAELDTALLEAEYQNIIGGLEL